MTGKEAVSNHFAAKSFETKEEAMSYAVKKAKIMEEYDAQSLNECKRLIVEEESKVLHAVNAKELSNLIQRWSDENLIMNISKAFFNKKAKL